MESKLILNRDMGLSAILDNQTDLEPEELEVLREIEQTNGLLGHAEVQLKKEIDLIEKSLMAHSEEYHKLMLLRGKVKSLKNMQHRAKIILDDKYDKIFEKRGIKNQVADLYASAIPLVEKGRRGRPRRIQEGA
jgi:hypothetical protein